MKKINKENFYLNTQGFFNICEKPTRLPDFTSKSGSFYWYENNGVIRHSNHWDKVASCYWELNGECEKCGWGVTAFCSFKDFNKLVYLYESNPISAKKYGYDAYIYYNHIIPINGNVNKYSTYVKGFIEYESLEEPREDINSFFKGFDEEIEILIS